MTQHYEMRKVPLFCTLSLEGKLYPNMQLISDREQESHRNLFFSGRNSPDDPPITIVIRDFHVERITPDRFRFSGSREISESERGEKAFRYVEGEFAFDSPGGEKGP